MSHADDERVRITLITPEYPPMAGGGGIGTHTALLARELAALGHSVTVIARGDADTTSEEDGATVIRLRPRWFPNPTLLTLIHRVRVALVARSTRPDVCHAAEWGAEAAAVTLLRGAPLITRLATPTYIVDELNGTRSGRDRLVRRLERLQAERSVIVYGPTLAITERIAADWGIPLAPPIPNPIDVVAVREAAKGDPGIELPKRFIAFVGRLERRKGVDVFGAAMAVVLSENPDLHAVVVGRVAEAAGNDVVNQLRQATVAVRDRVHEVGELPRERALAVVGRAEVVVVPSRWESFGYTCLEAMALGRPVVASAVGGLAEIVEHGRSGLLVPPGNPAELAEAVRTLLCDRNVRAAVAAGGQARSEDFDGSLVVIQVAAMLERAAGQGRGQAFDPGIYRAGYRRFFRPDSRRDPFHRLYRAKLDLVVREMNSRPPTKVLDLGGGFGRLADRIADHHQVVLVDISEEMLREARQRCSRRAALVQADARHLPFRDGAFPLLVSLDLVTHVRELDVCLPEMQRVLEPGRTALFDTTNAAPWWVLRYPSYVRWRPVRLIRTMRANGVLPEWTPLVRHHDASEVEAAAPRSGFLIDRRWGIGPRWAPKWHLWRATKTGP